MLPRHGRGQKFKSFITHQKKINTYYREHNMPIKVTATITRPSTAIKYFGEEFWSLPEVISHVKTTYEDTQKLLSTSFEDSADSLTHVWTEYWDSQTSVEEYWGDTFLNPKIADRNNYRTQNGIDMTYVIEQVDSAPVGVFYRP